jgi:hypothetical protein
MTVFNGSQGSICLYYKGLLVSSFPLSKQHTMERYQYQGDYIIRHSKGIPIKNQINAYLHYCNMIHERKLNKQGIRRNDHIYFLNCLMALLRLRVIENDELNGFMCFKKKKKC